MHVSLMKLGGGDKPPPFFFTCFYDGGILDPRCLECVRG